MTRKPIQYVTIELSEEEYKHYLEDVENLVENIKKGEAGTDEVLNLLDDYWIEIKEWGV